MTLRHVKAGDVLVLRDHNFRARRMKVAKVGREYLYLDGRNSRTGYSRDTGIANDGYGNARLQTEEEFAKETERDLALQQLRTWGITLATHFHDRAPAIRDAVEPLLKSTGERP